jgi:hypothetical protein
MTPYIGFSNATLASLPHLAPGDEVDCPYCTERHRVSGTPVALFYKCGEDAYLAGVNGRNVMGVKSDCAGTT